MKYVALLVSFLMAGTASAWPATQNQIWVNGQMEGVAGHYMQLDGENYWYFGPRIQATKAIGLEASIGWLRRSKEESTPFLAARLDTMTGPWSHIEAMEWWYQFKTIYHFQMTSFAVLPWLQAGEESEAVLTIGDWPGSTLTLAPAFYCPLGDRMILGAAYHFAVPLNKKDQSKQFLRLELILTF